MDRRKAVGFPGLVRLARKAIVAFKEGRLVTLCLRRMGIRAAPHRQMTVHLTLANRLGSVEHYWHFFMGFFLPLLAFHDSFARNCRLAAIVVRSCGPMDHHLRDLKWRNLNIVDKSEHEILRSLASPDLCYVTVHGIDREDVYNRELITSAVRYLEKKWNRERRLVPVRSPFLTIERASPQPFYLSDAAEIRESGSLRRSIPNMNQIVEVVCQYVKAAPAIVLEDMPLRRQYELFHGADVILYQHGAAMANLVFCRPGTAVIEILPETLVPEKREMTRTLCELLGLRYFRIRQESEHSAVDLDLVRSAVQSTTGRQSTSGAAT